MRNLWFIILVMLSCSQQKDFNVISKNIEINIKGILGPSLIHKNKFYCYFTGTNGDFGNSHNEFHILNLNGNIESRINIPEDLQTFYFDLFVRNDTVFTTQYYNQNTYYLNEAQKTWVKTTEASDLVYEDDQYLVYNIDYGEWGGVTWFEEKNSKKQYEIAAIAPLVNKLDNSYYLTSRDRVLRIDNPKEMEAAKKTYQERKSSYKANYAVYLSHAESGAKEIYNDSTFDWESNLGINTSFIANNSLYHIYRDSSNTYIGKLKDGELSPVYTFEKGFSPHNFHYNNKNRIQNNEYQTISFFTKGNYRYGIIEINKGEIKVFNFINMYREHVFTKDEVDDWFKNNFLAYCNSIEHLSLDKIDAIEQKAKAIDNTQTHKISHYLLDGKDIATPRIYRKKTKDDFFLQTMYYYGNEKKTIELIEFRWEGKNIETHVMEFLDFMDKKIGKHKVAESNKDSFTGKWETKSARLTLFAAKNVVELRILKK